MKNQNSAKIGIGGLFAVASVWFGAHAGGGFATGNQATQYYVQYGYYAPIMAVISMIILAFTLKECIIMCNNHGFTNYKPLFEEMWAPFTKLELLFEVYFYTIVLCTVGAAIAGAATLFQQLGLNYFLAVLIVGTVLFFLTIFGASFVARATTIMTIIILCCTAIIFFMGIRAKMPEIGNIFYEKKTAGGIGMPLMKVLNYAGFQAFVIPSLISCAQSLRTAKNASRAMIIGFLINSLALGFSCLMLLGWYQAYMQAGALDLPVLFICQRLGVSALTYFYSIALFLCFISTGVTSVYGLIPRFEGASVFKKLGGVTMRRGIISLLAMVVSMAVSLIGLTNIIKYGYNYCGYFGIFIIVLPMLTIGRIKNKNFLKVHKQYKGE